MSFGSWKCAGGEHTRPRSLQRAQLLGLGESPAVQRHAQPFGLLADAGAGFQTKRQHDHVEFLLDLLHLRTRIHEPQIPGLGHFESAGDERPHVTDTDLLRPFAVAVKILAERTQIEEKDRHLQARLVLPGEDRLFGSRHAADRGTIVVAAGRIAGTDALKERQSLGGAAIGGPANVPLGRPGGGEHPLELHVGDDVGSEAEAEFAPPGGVECLEPGRKDDRADFEIAGLPALVVIDRARLADLCAESALAGTKMDAVVAVDHRHARRGLRMGQIDRGPGRQSLVIAGQVRLRPFHRDGGEIHGSGGADERAGPTHLALVGPLAEGRADLPPCSAAKKADRSAAHQLVASADAQPTKDALSLGRRLEGRRFDLQSGGKLRQFP